MFGIICSQLTRLYTRLHHLLNKLGRQLKGGGATTAVTLKQSAHAQTYVT